jgi:glycosyltransferase involved in cell wall biosynthesis
MSSPGSPADAVASSVVLYTSQFPTPVAPGRCVFSLRLAGALRRQRATSVLCPLPFVPDLERFRRDPERRGVIGVSGETTLEGVPVKYLRHLAIPVLSRPFTARVQALRATGEVRRLARHARRNVINAHWVYPDGVAAVHMGRKLGLPVVLTALGCDVNDYPDVPGIGEQIREALKAADAVTGVSRELADKVIALGVPAERVFFIPNGVDKRVFHWDATRRDAMRQRHGMAAGEHYIGFIGRLEQEKGPDVLVRALGELHAAGRLKSKCIFLGAGSMLESLQGEVARLGLGDHVRFAGAQPPGSIADWMLALDTMCLTSRREGMPNVVLEAMASGLPVVATAVGAVPSLIDEGAGIVVPSEDPGALAAALDAAATRDWPRDQLSTHCAHPSWDQVASQYLQLFDQVAERREAGQRNGS